MPDSPRQPPKTRGIAIVVTRLTTTRIRPYPPAPYIAMTLLLEEELRCTFHQVRDESSLPHRSMP